jgi:pyruvate formate lyase activating enzyme
MDRSGRVFHIKRYAIHDGPGIRTTVFLKGCPLGCPWCHNPEGVSPASQLMWWEGRCLGCEACMGVCRMSAILLSDAGLTVDVNSCDMCGYCAGACCAQALQVVGRDMTVREVLDEVERDVVFYERSGGGVTFSGGEPLAQPEFLMELLNECKKAGLHTVVDTSGYADAGVLEALIPDVDLFLYDIKTVDEEAHMRLTGVSNKRVLDNLRMLFEKGSRVRIRYSVIPGVNDCDGDIDGLGLFLASLGSGIEVDLLPYHRVGVDKARRLAGRAEPEVFRIPPAGHLGSIRERLCRQGHEVKIGDSP